MCRRVSSRVRLASSTPTVSSAIDASSRRSRRCPTEARTASTFMRASYPRRSVASRAGRARHLPPKGGLRIAHVVSVLRDIGAKWSRLPVPPRLPHVGIAAKRNSSKPCELRDLRCWIIRTGSVCSSSPGNAVSGSAAGVWMAHRPSHEPERRRLSEKKTQTNSSAWRRSRRSRGHGNRIPRPHLGRPWIHHLLARQIEPAPRARSNRPPAGFVAPRTRKTRPGDRTSGAGLCVRIYRLSA